MAGEEELTNRSTDVVTFTILIDSNEISSDYHVQAIVVGKKVNRIPWAKIIFYDGDAAGQDFMISNQQDFMPGKEIEIKAGYHGEEETIFKGIIIKHGIKAKSNRASELMVECRDVAIKLTGQRKSAYYTNALDSDIITDIIESYNITADVESTGIEQPETVKYDCTDWDFIVSRAESNGFLVIPDDGTLRVSPPDPGQDPVLTLSYGISIIEFEAEMDARNVFSSVKSSTWDLKIQDLAEEEGSGPDFSEPGNFSINDISGIIHSDELNLFHGGERKTEEMKAWADAKLLKSHLAKIRGRVRLEGYAQLKPDNMVTLEGVGDRFNGNVFVSAVTHQIYGGNWLTDIEIGLAPEWFSESHKDIDHPPASGLIPAIQGLHIGKVVQLGEDELEGDHRVLVRIPFIEKNGGTDAKGIWARMSNVFAGENRGMIFRPEVEDEVIIGFINGDPRNAVVLGALNSNKFPAPTEANDDNFEKGIYTKGEMKLTFDDDKKHIKLETKSGNSVLLSEDEAGIIIADENSNTITMSSDGISIESAKDIILKASGDIKMEGNNVEQTAQMSYKATGTSGVEVTASGNTVIKGALVQIN